MTIRDVLSWRVFAVLWLGVLSACQGQQTPHVPAEVRDTVVRQLAEAGIAATEVDRAAGLFKPVDLSSQAAPDWLVNFSALPSAPFCGTGGCPLQVWVKTGQTPYSLAFDRQVLGYDVARHSNGRSWLGVELHGVFCGGTGSDACRYHFEWHGNAGSPEGYFGAASIWGKPTRYAGPLVQALPARAPIGSPVATALEDYRAACAAAGGTAELDDALAFLPDFNRDGRRELLFDTGWAYCQRDGEAVAVSCATDACKSRLFTEHGGQGWRAAWSGDPFAYAVDFSQPQPRVLIRPADCAKKCPEQVLAWHESERRFVPVSP